MMMMMIDDDDEVYSLYLTEINADDHRAYWPATPAAITP